jgi:hypothetical protein
MFDWNLFVARLAVALFGGAVIGYVIRDIEGFEPGPDIHSGPDDVERRARRAF